MLSLISLILSVRVQLNRPESVPRDRCREKKESIGNMLEDIMFMLYDNLEAIGCAIVFTGW